MDEPSLFQQNHVYAVRDSRAVYVSDSLLHLVRGYNKLHGRQYLTRTGLAYGMKRGRYKNLQLWEGPGNCLGYRKNEQIVLLNGLVKPATIRFLKATTARSTGPPCSATDSQLEEE